MLNETRKWKKICLWWSDRKDLILEYLNCCQTAPNHHTQSNNYTSFSNALFGTDLMRQYNNISITIFGISNDDSQYLTKLLKIAEFPSKSHRIRLDSRHRGRFTRRQGNFRSNVKVHQLHQVRNQHTAAIRYKERPFTENLGYLCRDRSTKSREDRESQDEFREGFAYEQFGPGKDSHMMLNTLIYATNDEYSLKPAITTLSYFGDSYEALIPSPRTG